MSQMNRSRRAVLRDGLLLPAAFALTAFPRPVAAQPALSPTPSCAEGATTPPQTAGPFFKPASPQRASLIEPSVDGERLIVEGLVLSTRCAPIAGAVVDLWHADAEGRYDNQGFRLRGHQYTDAAGRYRFETIVPGNYGPRTRHYHVKVGAPGQPVLTTQLYFPDEARNASDFLFRPELLMRLAADGSVRRGRFDFVVAMG
jgi:protocatechuate 3,4-dioxygenase beta subunit